MTPALAGKDATSSSAKMCRVLISPAAEKRFEFGVHDESALRVSEAKSHRAIARSPQQNVNYRSDPVHEATVRLVCCVTDDECTTVAAYGMYTATGAYMCLEHTVGLTSHYRTHL